MTYKTIYVGLTVLAASAVFAGCSGGASLPQNGAVPSGVAPMQNPADHGRGGQGCPNDDGGGVNVRPCHVVFDSGNPGPVDVRVMHGGRGRGGPNDRGRDRDRIVERDDCASRGIATIAKDSNRVYSVKAGTVAGSCSARFSEQGNRNDDGGPGRGGNLRVVNNL